MGNFWNYYQQIPLNIDPIAFGIGFFSVSWYALMYLVGFGVVYSLLLYRIKKKEFMSEISDSFELKKELLLDLLLVAFAGLLIGGRMGYVLFYDLGFYAAHPLAIISPFDVSGNFIGVYGMSYHGGLLGALLAGWIFTKKKKLDFLRLTNFIAPAIPAGYFFGRMGNFLNNELYGRITDQPWGMYFLNDPYLRLRHPSQLYEAFLEGMVLFVVLWSIRNREYYREKIIFLYIFGYVVARFICEFFRQPDVQIGYILGYFTLGQLLSLGMIIGALAVFWKNNRIWYNQKTK